jgi:HSP20 family protein
MITRWSPFAFSSPFNALPQVAPVNVKRTEGGYRLEAALPGFKPEEVEVTLDSGVLTISARHAEERKTGEGAYLRREVYSGTFQRKMTLPTEVTADDIKAGFENGMLTVDVALPPAAQPARIPVGTTPALSEQAETTEKAA